MILFVFTWFFIPETRGKSSSSPFTKHTLTFQLDRTLEEIHEMFEAKLPARKFKGYVCTGVERYAAEAEGEKTGAEKAGVEHMERSTGEV